MSLYDEYLENYQKSLGSPAQADTAWAISEPKINRFSTNTVKDQDRYSESWGDTLSWIGDMFSNSVDLIWDLFKTGKDFIEAKVFNTQADQWIYDVDKYEDYMGKISAAETTWDYEWANKYRSLLVEEWVINYDKYNEFMKKQETGELDLEAKWVYDFETKTREQFLSSVAEQIKDNNDPFLQEVIFEAAEQQVKQFSDLYSNIVKTKETSSFSHQRWLDDMQHNINNQVSLFQDYIDNTIAANWNTKEGLNKTLEKEEFREIANTNAKLFYTISAASHKAWMERWVDDVLRWNMLQKVGWLIKIASGWLWFTLTGWSVLLEEWKQVLPLVWDRYDITEELRNLNLYREWEEWVFDSTARFIWETYDALPSILPSLVSMIAAKKAIWWSSLAKYVEWAKKYRRTKDAVFNTAQDLFVFDVIWRNMLWRQVSWQDIVDDFIMSWMINSISSMLLVNKHTAKNIFDKVHETYVKWSLKKVSPTDSRNVYFDDEINTLIEQWKKEEALIVSDIKWSRVTDDMTDSDLPELSDTNKVSESKTDLTPEEKANRDELLKMKAKSNDEIETWNLSETTKMRVAMNDSATKSQLSSKQVSEWVTQMKESIANIKLNSKAGDPILENKLSFVSLTKNLEDGNITVADIEQLIKTEDIESIPGIDSETLKTAVLEYLSGNIKNISALLKTEGDIEWFWILLNKALERYWAWALINKWAKVIWEHYWKYLKISDTEFQDVLTWEVVTKDKIRAKSFESVVDWKEYLTQWLRDILDTWADNTDLDITDKLFGNLIEAWVLDTNTARWLIKQIVTEAWFEFRNNRVIWNTVSVRNLLNVMGWISANLDNLSLAQMWALKLSFFMDAYKKYESMNVLTWDKKPFKYISRAWFNKYFFPNLWKKDWLHYKLTSGWENTIKWILESNLNNREKLDKLQEFSKMFNIISDSNIKNTVRTCN